MIGKLHDIRLFSFSHQNTSIADRDRLAFSDSEVASFIPEVRQSLAGEVAVLSTCNRTEFYVYGDVEWSQLSAFVETTKSADAIRSLAPADLTGADAARHLFRVASSMESLALGEDQILVQVKGAHQQVLGFDPKSPVLDRLYQFAIRAGKRVRTETSLCTGSVSIASASVELAKRIFGDFSKLHIGLIGAGETNENTAEHFAGNGATQFTVVNRTESKGVELADRFGGKYLPLSEIETVCRTADILVFATGAAEFLIDQKLMKRVMRDRGFKSLFVIDISNPRNVDPKVESVSGIYLYNIDDLEGVIRDNLASRQSEIPKAEIIVEEMVAEWELWLQTMRVTPTIAQLARFFDELRASELAGFENRLTDDQAAMMEEYGKRLTKKLLHNPITFLRNAVETDAVNPEDIDLIWKLFALKDKE